MKHVWILNHYAQEPSRPGGTRHYSLAKFLTYYGWTATIIAASTEHGTGRQRLEEGVSFRQQVCDGVNFIWVRTSGYSGNGFDRIKNMLEYTWRTLRPSTTAELSSPNAIIGSSVHPFAAWAGLRLAKRKKVPFIFEVRDLWPQTLIDMGRLREHSPLTLLLRHLERTLYQRAQRIISLLPDAYRYIKGLGIDGNKIFWIPNGADVHDYSALETASEEDSFVVMYFGAHGHANDIDTILRAFSIAVNREATKRIQLRLIGDGPKKNELIRESNELNLHNCVSFEDPVSKKKIPEIASKADAFIIAVRDLPGLYKYGISMNKLYDYMALGRPVLISVNASNNPIEEASCGITVEPGNPELLADGIIQLASLPLAERLRMGRAGRKYVETHHDYRLLAGELASALDDSVSEYGSTDR